MTLPTTDLLAIERTLLANERTFLSYFRSAVVFLASGLAILEIEFFESVRSISWALIALSPCTLGFGLWRSLSVRRKVLRHLRE